MKLHTAIAEMICVDTQPYSLVENDGFQRFEHAAQPHYEVNLYNFRFLINFLNLEILNDLTQFVIYFSYRFLVEPTSLKKLYLGFKSA